MVHYQEGQLYAHTAPHREKACYFDPQKITDQKYWARKIIDEKGVACKDDEWRWGTAQTVIHKYPSKDPLMYEASLRCSPTLMYMPTQNEQQEHILPQQHMGIVDSGATHLYIVPTTPHGPPDTSAATIKVGTMNGHVEKLQQNLPYPYLNWRQTSLQRDTSCHPSPTHSLVLGPYVMQTAPSSLRKWM